MIECFIQNQLTLIKCTSRQFTKYKVLHIFIYQNLACTQFHFLRSLSLFCFKRSVSSILLKISDSSSPPHMRKNDFDVNMLNFRDGNALLCGQIFEPVTIHRVSRNYLFKRSHQIFCKILKKCFLITFNIESVRKEQTNIWILTQQLPVFKD